MKIALLGDMALISNFDLTKNDKKSIEVNLSFLKDKLNEYDYVIANLETPLTNKRKSLMCKSMHLRSDPINVDILKYLKVNAVSIANNHMLDFGKQGLLDTIKILEENNIEWYGAFNKSLLKKFNDVSLSLSGYCCYSTNAIGIGKYINELSLNNLCKQMEFDKKNNAISLLSLHWGLEHTNYPSFDQIKIVQKINKYNDYIIHGHHSHTIQGYQRSDNKKICFYSLGNAIFDDCISINDKKKVELTDENKKTFIAGLNIDNEKIRFKGIGIQFNQYKASPFDIDYELNKLSNSLKGIERKEQYVDIENLRNKQISKTIDKKFGKKDLKWVLQRLNYYSIGSFLLGKIRVEKYKKIMEKFNEQ
ncbi:CapA family protein [[Eubacterium] hominis]|uniref:CapA family protein n=1 Tax=[Eubacterium] hominis TaxID=2764325 RepID=UPI003A4D74C9